MQAPQAAADLPLAVRALIGKAQYEERWTFDVALQINPTITMPQQSANALQVGLLNVDRTYPPQ